MASEEPDAGDRKVEPVTKLDAARRQLRTAIRMFFDEGDAVSIHTLASASQDVLHGLLKQQKRHKAKRGFVDDEATGRPLSFKDSALVRPEKRDEYWKLITEAQVFFKHADSDPSKILEFRPSINDFVLIDCVDMYLRYTGRWLKESVPFVPWFAATYPDTLKPDLLPGQTSALEVLARALQDVPHDLWKAAALASLAQAELLPNTD